MLLGFGVELPLKNGLKVLLPLKVISQFTHTVHQGLEGCGGWIRAGFGVGGVRVLLGWGRRDRVRVRGVLG